MGNSHGNTRRSRRTSSSSSYDRRSSDTMEINKKINEKECIFIAMQSEIDKAITENNRETMKSLATEIAAHILDLNQLKKIELTSTNRGRSQKIIYNFELSLAKLKSIYNYDTAMMKERDRHFSRSPSSSFYVNPIAQVEPDIVSDLIRFDSTNSVNRSSCRENSSTLPNVPENEIGHQFSRSNSLYSNQPATFEESLVTIESEFDVLKDQAQRPVEDVNDYYQMDKGVFYLYVKIKNLELPENSTLNERKFRLLKELAEFRTSLDKMSGELEEHRDINQEINTLELLLDSASDSEIPSLGARALVLQETIERTSWNPWLTERKIEILRRLARYLERIAYTSPSPSIDNSVDHIYGNLNSLQEEMKDLKVKQENIYNNIENQETKQDDVDNESEHFDDKLDNDESIYGNVEIIRQNEESKISKNLQRAESNASQRGTIYVNADTGHNSAYESHFLPVHDNKVTQEVVAKRPLPLPRNYDDKIVNDLPKHWQRLNEIFEKELLTDTDKSEVADIQRHAEVAKNLFERKIKRIMEKLEDSVEL